LTTRRKGKGDPFSSQFISPPAIHMEGRKTGRDLENRAVKAGKDG
jgi:hypothetical protein